jgi:Flp pilus assembly protein TadD
MRNWIRFRGPARAPWRDAMNRFLIAGGLILACLLLGTEARAQGAGTARGKVVDEKGQALEGAVVSLDFQGGVTRKYTTKTNKKGEFTQVGLHPGVYRVTATKDGYQGSYTDVKINLGQPTDIPNHVLQSAAGARAGASNAAEVEKANAELRQLVKDAEAAAAAGRYDEAIAAFQGVLAKNVAMPEEVHFRIGQLHSQKKDWAAAEAAYLKVLELKPGHSGAQLELANAYQLSGQKEKAAAVMAKAQAAGEGDANVQYNTGVLHINNAEYDQAAVAFKKAIAIDPNHAESYYYLGTIALNKNDTPEAIANLEKYLSLNPTSAQNVATAQGLLKALKPQK